MSLLNDLSAELDLIDHELRQMDMETLRTYRGIYEALQQNATKRFMETGDRSSQQDMNEYLETIREINQELDRRDAEAKETSGHADIGTD